MKKAKHAVPNQLLKEARELRGWSQKYVAEQIGADHYYLSRWERGTASPSPYYRSKLCTLFGVDAKALGLVHDTASKREDSAEADAAPEPGEEALAPAIIHDPAIPPLLAPAEDLIGRDQLLPQLRAYLCADTTPGLIALHGLPGVGKTTLAVTLAHDQAIQEHFDDGILWAGLGPHPDISGLLSHWGALLGVPESEGQKLSSPDAWIRRIRAAIGERHMLLIIDNAWEIDHALAFKVGGPHCAYLVTSRFPAWPSSLPGAARPRSKNSATRTAYACSPGWPRRSSPMNPRPRRAWRSGWVVCRWRSHSSATICACKPTAGSPAACAPPLIVCAAAKSACASPARNRCWSARLACPKGH